MKSRRILLPFVLCAAMTACSQEKQASVQETLGYPANARLLIIHADDTGMSHSVNRATFEALDKGWITSASILVPCPWFPEVVTFARSHPDADLGIHLALNSEWTSYRWGPVGSKDKVASLLDEQSYFPMAETAVAQNAKPAEVEYELRAQIERARSQGIHLTHLDTHMGSLFGSPQLFRVYESMGREYGLPILWEKKPGQPLPPGIPQPKGEALLDTVVQLLDGPDPKDWLATYKSLLSPLKPGVYELIVHLAYDDDEMRGATSDHPDWGAAWRQHDFDMVRSQEFQKFLRDQGFILVNWRQLTKALPKNYHLKARFGPAQENRAQKN